MSDDDFMMDSGAEDEDYDFQYEDDDAEESADVDIENKYYNAKQIKQNEPRDAIEEFLGIVELEEEKGDWGFKGLKQVIKLEFKLKEYDKAIEHYKQLLTYIKSAVTRNYSEKSINNMLDYISLSNDPADMACMEKFYALTLDSFQGSSNERLWLKTNIKLARLWLDRKEYQRLARSIKDLHKACQRPDGTDDPSKGTYLLEVYALEIQMLSEQKNNKRLKGLYNKSLAVKSAVPHPKIMGVIRECGGKMHMSEENWKEAQSDFFEAFRNYDEAGSMQRYQVLKYLVLTSMLVNSEINPFDSQETKPYKSNPRIVGMTDLVDAYQRQDIKTYELILQKHKDQILDDPFIREHIDEVTRNIRTEALIKLIKPFTRFTLAFIAKELQIPVDEAKDILGFLILDKKVHGQINANEGTVEISSHTDVERMEAMQEWSASLNSLWMTVFAPPESNRDDYPGPGWSSVRERERMYI
ncbi:hypothetical protein Dda_0271 [Drechslerella dactyloides]|uniref:COP9 signalosome complex subunit 2 n=1 Tax=Drechslerella dactyloides TaxID=74499 RepID=A0AAD6NMJ2_DREDA|nr:hypothetical protein Dda_0271 [Drechslerella dactyloides]